MFLCMVYILITMDRIQIVDYLAKKVFNGELIGHQYCVMLKNKQIYSVWDYRRLVESNKLSPEDAFVFIDSGNYSEYESYIHLVQYLFPLITEASIYGIIRSYLAKLGFYISYDVVYPATGLKYYAVVRLFSDRLVIEIVDIDTVATNIGLRKTVMDLLGKGILTQKEINDEQLREIGLKLQRQKLFAGYNSEKAYFIIHDYYKYHYTSLAKDTLAITDAYNRIFQPYRVVYDTRTRRQVFF